MKNNRFSDVLTKLATDRQAMDRYKICRATLMKLAEESHAIRRFGRSVRFDIEVLDREIEKNY